MGPLGWQETVFLFVLALLIFGPKKLPELGKTIGKAMTEFRRASSELKATFDREMHSIERENESLKEVTRQYTNEITNYDSYYDSGAYGSESYDSTASVPSVGASATQGAESNESTVVQANGSTASGKTPEPEEENTVAAAHPARAVEDSPAAKS